MNGGSRRENHGTWYFLYLRGQGDWHWFPDDPNGMPAPQQDQDAIYLAEFIAGKSWAPGAYVRPAPKKRWWS